MKKGVCLALILSLALLLFPAGASAQGYDPVMKIGLAFDGSALAAANLQNPTGSAVGYTLGYYDSSRSFVPLYSIPGENKITVLKNADLWVSGSTYSELPLSSYTGVVGTNCVQLDALFDQGEGETLRESLSRAGYDAYLCAVSGGYRVRVGKWTEESDAQAAQAGVESVCGYPTVLRGSSRTCYTVVVTGTDEILFQLDYLGSARLGIEPESELTWFKGYQYRGGFEYYRASGGNLSVINVVGLTDYIKGVLPYEVSPSWPVEAQKAQALCAKCYALNNKGKHSGKGFDLCNNTDCQMYQGANRATAVSDSAVEAVDGLYVLYNGEICQTYYHASSGGYTEDAGNIWGEDIPYLRAVEDIYLEDTRPYSATYTLDEITWIFQQKGYTSQSITDVYVSRYSQAGNVIELCAVQSDGSLLRFTGDRARTALNSPTLGKTVGSHRYTLVGGTGGSSVSVNGVAVSAGGLYAVGSSGRAQTINPQNSYALTGRGLESVEIHQNTGSASGVYTLSGTGSGHNIGMSQMGAYAMAQRGFTCEEIIAFYFTGAQVGYYNAY